MQRILSALMVFVVMGTGCTTDPDPQGPIGADGQPSELPEDLVLAALTDFDECDDLEAYVKDAALDLVTPWGLGGGGWGPMPMMEEMDRTQAEAAQPAEDMAGGADDGAVGSNETGTNVQEAGVDEPDRVKTDGRLLYVADTDALRILDVTGSDPVEIGRLELRGADAQLLLADDRLLVTSSSPQAIPFADESRQSSSTDDDAARLLPGYGWSGTTTLTMVDISDPRSPRVLERLTVDGTTLSARLIDTTARVVVRMEQGNLPWTYPDSSGLRAERRALEANRELIRNSDVEDWLPYAVYETADGRSREGTLLACDHVSRPESFSGLGMLSVLTIDVGGGNLALDPQRHVGVLAGGDTVYASRDRLYVATTRWLDWDSVRDDDQAMRRAADEVSTDIHAFDLGDRSRAVYMASGRVVGTLLSQWAMSEHDGVLRVASTRDTPWGSSSPSESYVTTLRVGDDALRQLGRVDGLGRTERIFAVRFIGDLGYVVTFRQTDPLYVIDLSDPAAPTVEGELKILGYSAYLHPVGGGLLLGVGQDADDEGRTKGTKLSLFDVSDSADPREIDTLVLSDGSSDAEHDHRAFMHHPGSGLTVIPYTRWSHDPRAGRDDVDTGALAVAVRDRRIDERGRLSHVPAWLEELRDELEGRDQQDFTDAEWRQQERIWQWGHLGRISRSMVVGGKLLTISEIGVGVHDPDSLDDIGWLAFEE